ncbi:MAG: biopolymer transporter ExbD [Gammaproteobacteria bacterium]|nr:biopolymer transporter ExbD [Gammaproteobacteria bacterium]
MAFDGLDDNADNNALSEINILPLVDVMLVLLILFIITAPLFTPHAIKIDIPAASGETAPDKPGNISVAIDKNGALFWDNEAVGEPELAARLREAAQRTPQPELHLRADKTTQYYMLAKIMSMAKKAGIHRLGFVTKLDFGQN